MHSVPILYQQMQESQKTEIIKKYEYIAINMIFLVNRKVNQIDFSKMANSQKTELKLIDLMLIINLLNEDARLLVILNKPDQSYSLKKDEFVINYSEIENLQLYFIFKTNKFAKSGRKKQALQMKRLFDGFKEKVIKIKHIDNLYLKIAQQYEKILNNNKDVEKLIEQNKESKIIIKIDKKEAVYCEEELNFGSVIDEYLKQKRINKLYKHQKEALDKIMLENKNIIVNTQTSSGKSLIYMIPIIKSIQQNTDNKALYLGVNKALTNNQMLKMKEIIALNKIVLSKIDGDLVAHNKVELMNNSNVVFSNIDYIHFNLLRFNKERYARFLANLKIIVIDEMHYYLNNSRLALNIKLILNRLLRLCCADVKLIVLSATIDVSLVKRMFPTTVFEVISQSSNMKPKKTVVFEKLSSNEINQKTTEVALQMLNNKMKLLVFCKSKTNSEHIYHKLKSDNPDVFIYTGAYDASHRQAVEGVINNVETKAFIVVCTNILELGIDLNHLNAVVINGDPLSVDSFVQQCGRSGRSNNESVCFVHLNETIDITYLSKLIESVQTGADYTSSRVEYKDYHLELMHLFCAANEKPLCPKGDANYFQNIEHYKRQFVVENEMLLCPIQHKLRSYEQINIRNIDNEATITIMATSNEILDKVQINNVNIKAIHVDSIFLKNNCKYAIVHVDNNMLCAVAQIVLECDYTTKGILKRDLPNFYIYNYTKTATLKKSHSVEYCKMEKTLTIDSYLQIKNNLTIKQTLLPNLQTSVKVQIFALEITNLSSETKLKLMSLRNIHIHYYSVNYCVVECCFGNHHLHLLDEIFDLVSNNSIKC